MRFSKTTTIAHLSRCLAVTALAAAGCTSPTLSEGQEAFRRGDLELAADRIERFAEDDARPENAVIAHLELGSVRRARGRPEASKEATAIVPG